MSTPNGAQRFRAAVVERDVEAMVGAMAEDVQLHNPTSPEPFAGRDAARFIFGMLVDIFEEFEYTHLFTGGHAGGGGAGVSEAMVFRARVGGVDVQGVDVLDLDERGDIKVFTVLLRPAAALTAMTEAVTARMRG